MRLDALATAIRSKNAGPLLLTFDIIFPTDAAFAQGVASMERLRAHVVVRYGRLEADVRSFAHAPSRAIKITIPRARMSGSVGDTDVYGAQQHGPLLEFEL
jgi:hypothetical protein